MQIDLTKSQLLMNLLKQIVIGLSNLSNEDLALHQRINELRTYLKTPRSVNGGQLALTLVRAQEIASSYDMKDDKSIMDLPSLFFHARTEIDHQITSTKLMEQACNDISPNIAQLKLEVNRLAKHSSRRTKRVMPC